MKDTNNLLTDNQWSGSDYLENNTGFTGYNSTNTLRESVNEWSSIGENSLRITRLTSSSHWVRVYYSNSIKSKIVTGKATIKTTDSSVTVSLLELNGGTTVQTATVVVPAGTVFNVNLSLTSGDANTRFALHTVSGGNIGDVYYIDDLSIVSS